MMKKSYIVGLVLFLLLTLQAGNIRLGWDSQGDNLTNFNYNFYTLKGSNAVFKPGDPKIKLVSTISSTNTSVTISNLATGAWSFVATTVDIKSNEESIYSNVAWTNAYNVPTTPNGLKITFQTIR